MGDVEVRREYIKDETEPSIDGDGSYTNPFKYEDGMETIETMWYYLEDKELPHECIKSGTPSGFYDAEYFDYIEEI